MGNQLKNCMTHCVRLQQQQANCQTRYIQITGNQNRTYRCKKFYISSQPIFRHKLNQLIIFTDATLTMKIANTSLRLNIEEMQKLQQTLRVEMYNNNLSIKQDCFVLNAIEEQIDSTYGEFREFPEDNSKSKTLIADNDELINEERQKLKTQIQAFTLLNKSRAFRFRNPIRNLSINQIIVVIVPLFQKSQDLMVLKQAVEQSLSMTEDLKSVGVSEISYLLGYQSLVFQKIILEYILGYSKTRKDYVFKRMKEFYYLTASKGSITEFFKYLNIYTKNKLERVECAETVQGEQVPKMTKIRRLGSGGNNPTKKDPKSSYLHEMEDKASGNISQQKIRQQHPMPNSPNVSSITNINNLNNTSSNQNILDSSSSLQCKHSNKTNSSHSSNNSFHNNSLYVANLHRPTNNNMAMGYNGRFGGVNPISNNNQLGVDYGQIDSDNKSRASETSQIRNVKLKSFKSKESNASDYF